MKIFLRNCFCTISIVRVITFHNLFPEPCPTAGCVWQMNQLIGLIESPLQATTIAMPRGRELMIFTSLKRITSLLYNENTFFVLISKVSSQVYHWWEGGRGRGHPVCQTSPCMSHLVKQGSDAASWQVTRGCQFFRKPSNQPPTGRTKRRGREWPQMYRNLPYGGFSNFWNNMGYPTPCNSQGLVQKGRA